MNYDLLASKSCLLTDIADQLHEPSKKNQYRRSTFQTPPKMALCNYLSQLKKICPTHPIIHIDGSDVIKPKKYQFEALFQLRDGSASIPIKSVYQKAYLVTESTVLTNNPHPVRLFSKICSSYEKDFRSTNSITFSAIERAKNCLGNLLLLWSMDMTIIRCFSH